MKPTSLSVLLIADDPQECRTLRAELEAGGATVSDFRCEQSGIEAALERRPDCIVLDCDIPGGKADEVFTHLKRENGELSRPIVAMMAANECGRAIQLMKLGAADVFMKEGVSSESLYGLVAGAVEGFKAQCELSDKVAADRQMAAIVQNSPDAIVSVDLNGVVRSWNPAATALFGYSGDESLGHSVDDLIVPPDRQEERRLLYESVIADGQAARADTVRLHKDGRLIDVEIYLSPMPASNNGIGAISVTMRDITERIKTASRLSAIRDAICSQTFTGPVSGDLPETLSVPARLQRSAVQLAHDAGLFDAPHEHGFDLITRLAGNVLHAPVSLMTVIDDARQFFVSSYGLPEPVRSQRQKPLETSYCRYVIETAETFVIRDASLNPLVAHIGAYKDGFRSYLGVPVLDQNGITIASLSVVDSVARIWTRQDQLVLDGIAKLLMRELAARAAFQALQSAQNTLRESEAYSRSIFESSPDCVKILDLEGQVERMNINGQACMEIDDFDSVRGSVWTSLWPESERAKVDGAIQEARTGGTGRINGFCTTARGSPRWWDVVVKSVPGADGTPVRLIASSRDMTERKKFEQRIALLLGEVSHRSKNMLSIVLSIARQTASANTEDFIQKFAERIQGLSASHDLLVRNDWHSIGLVDLVASQLVLFKERLDNRIVFHGPPLRIGPSAAQAIGMALHELGTNAVKYGALSNSTGNVAISWRLDTVSDCFNMDWVEEGGPLVSPTSRRGFGSTVLKRMTEASLDSKVEFDYAPTGLIWRLSCPIPNVVDVNGAGPRIMDVNQAAGRMAFPS